MKAALDPFNYADFCAQALAFETANQEPIRPRFYPGYPTVELDRKIRRPWRSIFKTLEARRSVRGLAALQWSKRELSTVLRWSHGAMRPEGAGPVPSSGGLQSLELYIVSLSAGWLQPGSYHYSRDRHLLSRIGSNGERAHWRSIIPSFDHVTGGSLVWILVGDSSLINAKYGERGLKLLYLEAGHLMQNLCLVSTTINACTVPLGGFFERQISRELKLPASDVVLYVGIAGKVG